MIGDFFRNIFNPSTGDSAITEAFQSVVGDVSAQMASLVPIGIALLAVMAGPRIIRRIFNAFI